MIEGLKRKGFTVKSIETALGFSNGSLGKKLSEGRMEMLVGLYESHCGGSGSVDYLLMSSGVKVRATDENVRTYFGHLFVGGGAVGSEVLSAEKIEPSAVVSAEVSKPSMYDLRKLMDAPMKGIFDVEKEVVVEEVDYKKLYEECEFSDEYRALWERIKADDNVSTKDKNEWKLRLGAK